MYLYVNLFCPLAEILQLVQVQPYLMRHRIYGFSKYPYLIPARNRYSPVKLSTSYYFSFYGHINNRVDKAPCKSKPQYGDHCGKNYYGRYICEVSGYWEYIREYDIGASKQRYYRHETESNYKFIHQPFWDKREVFKKAAHRFLLLAYFWTTLIRPFQECS